MKKLKYNYIEKYYDLISSDNTLASKKVIISYKMLIEKLNKNDEIYYDNTKASHIINFIEKFCKNSKGKWGGKNIELLLFQKAFLSAIFGTMNKKTNTRQFNKAVLYVGRKNGKSVLASGIALYMLIADGESGAEIYAVATKSEQAKIVWQESDNMVKQSIMLSKHIKKTNTVLNFKQTFSTFRPLSRESKGEDGLNASCVLADEIHAWTDQNLYDVVYDSMATRVSPLFLETSTAGTVRGSVYDDNYEFYSNCLLKSELFSDEKTFTAIYELDNPSNWKNKKYWRQANPSLGVLKSVEFLENTIKKAMQENKGIKNIKTKHFNIRETSESAYLSYNDIKNNLTYTFDEGLDDTIERPDYAIGGVDLSKTNDLTHARILWYDKNTKKFITKGMYFMLESKIQEREKEDKVPYSKWIERGFIKTTKGTEIKASEVTKWFIEVQQTEDIYIHRVGYDAWSSKYWVEEMEGHFGNIMTAVNQGAKTLSLPLQKLKNELGAGNMNYNNNPVDIFNFCNLIVKEDRNGNILPSKDKNKNKIDGVATLINSFVIYLKHKIEYDNLWDVEDERGCKNEIV